MADWDTANYDNPAFTTNGHSRQNSEGSAHSGSNKENRTLDRQESQSTLDNSSQKELILRGGNELREESRTDVNSTYENWIGSKNIPDIPGRQPISYNSTMGGTTKAKVAKSPYTAPSIDSVPEEEITIPKDANISSFTADQLANFLKCLKIEDRIVTHLHRKSVDGKRFARLKDSELENLGMKNAVVLFFRDKSNVKHKVKGQYML